MNPPYPVAGAEPDLHLRHGTVCVTRAASDLGRTVVARLVGAGWYVVAVDYSERHLTQLAALHPNTVEVLSVDPSNPDDARRIAEAVGGPRTLCHVVALVGGALATGLDQAEAAPKLLAAGVREQVDDTAAIVAACLPALRHTTRANKSITLCRVPNAIDGGSFSARAVSYNTLAATTEPLAATLGTEGIRVNAVAPGMLRTQLANELHKRRPAYFDEQAAATALGRLATTADCADAIVALALSLTAVTGQVLRVDAGAGLR